MVRYYVFQITSEIFSILHSLSKQAVMNLVLYWKLRDCASILVTIITDIIKLLLITFLFFSPHSFPSALLRYPHSNWIWMQHDIMILWHFSSFIIYWFTWEGFSSLGALYSSEDLLNSWHWQSCFFSPIYLATIGTVWTCCGSKNMVAGVWK